MFNKEKWNNNMFGFWDQKKSSGIFSPMKEHNKKKADERKIKKDGIRRRSTTLW